MRPPHDDWKPITVDEVVMRALSAQHGTWVDDEGTTHVAMYDLGGGAVWWAPTPWHELGNPHPGTVDCSGFLAWVLKYRRGRWNCNNILADALGPQRKFRKLERGELVRASDILIKGGPDRDHDGVPDPGGHGHVGPIVGVHKEYNQVLRSRDPDWPENLDVAHSSGRRQLTVDPKDPEHRRYGTVRVTNAEAWELAGYIVRAKHVVESVAAAAA